MLIAHSRRAELSLQMLGQLESVNSLAILETLVDVQEEGLCTWRYDGGDSGCMKHQGLFSGAGGGGGQEGWGAQPGRH